MSPVEILFLTIAAVLDVIQTVAQPAFYVLGSLAFYKYLKSKNDRSV